MTYTKKRTIRTLVIIMCFCVNTTYASSSSDSIKPWIPDIPVWKLVPTQNYWMFLNLNTMTGEIYEVQFSMDDEKRFGQRHSEGEISAFTLTGKEPVDRFDLVPTENIYTFVLLDKIGGTVWQIQWGKNKAKVKIGNFDLEFRQNLFKIWKEDTDSNKQIPDESLK